MAENSSLASPARKWKYPLFVFFEGARSVFKLDDLGLEILQIAFPAALALAADPIASLIDTAFIGHLGSVEIAAVGVSIAIFNQVSKVAIFPIVNITTSFVAEEDTMKRIASEPEKCGDLEKGAVKVYATEETALENLDASIPEDKMKEFEEGFESGKTLAVKSNTAAKRKEKHERRKIPSETTALAVGGVLGLLQTLLLIFLAKPVLGLMGVKAGSAMLSPARKYLTLRALGSPAVALSLAMQGVFRGFKDTKTPLYATVAGDTTNIILDPIFIFVCHLGVSGAAIAHVLSQYLISIILLCKLIKQVDLLPPSTKHMQFSKFLKSGFLILARVLGATPMAAFQVCLQAILACAIAEKDFKKATATARRVIQMGFVLGLILALVVGLGIASGHGGSSKHRMLVSSFTILWIRWNMNCFEHIHASACLCRLLEGLFRYRTVESCSSGLIPLYISNENP
ncbi:OLC1v1029984C1 [Oldenlandia corymbosa var. corymbosa]|uniref:Protein DETOXIFICATION n=1 Tax=Oldenlandia corymbosa var. corymbosa TaxID=529605 RepID=A0AAV1CI02_OLDCO|nr:OLC1v1029984C1 [Oldenlandia corymbosa var. corymbosa]